MARFKNHVRIALGFTALLVLILTTGNVTALDANQAELCEVESASAVEASPVPGAPAEGLQQDLLRDQPALETPRLDQAEECNVGIWCPPDFNCWLSCSGWESCSTTKSSVICDGTEYVCGGEREPICLN